MTEFCLTFNCISCNNLSILSRNISVIFLAKITVVTSISAVQAQLKQNLKHQAHLIQNTQVMRVLWKVVQALTMEVMDVASDVVGIADVDFTVVGMNELH